MKGKAVAIGANQARYVTYAVQRDVEIGLTMDISTHIR
jgi:hypothetical protein